MRGSATYLFALLRRPRPPETRGAPPGLPGAEASRALPVGEGLWLIVATVPLVRYSAVAIERGLKDMAWVSTCALEHERVVEYFSRAGALLPMRLFTLFGSDERAIRHVRARRVRLGRLLREVEGRQEWGVRLSGAARVPSPRRRPKAGPRRSGTEFLLAKKAERDRDGGRIDVASAEAERLFRALAEHAEKSRRRPVPEGGRARLWLDAAFLVPRSGRRRFEAALRRQARGLSGRGLEVTLTGPWPPYNFAEPVS